jgi:GT2 family glycosyltransferase
MRASILIPSFQRAELLQWHLHSLAYQNIDFEYEVIVLNDGLPDKTEEVCARYNSRIKNLRYVFTGQRNINPYGDLHWRVPGFPINIGAKMSTGEILILACAEMFLIERDVIATMIGLMHLPKQVVTPEGRDDRGHFLHQIPRLANSYPNALRVYRTMKDRLNVRLPFYMAMRRNEFFDIGGYDEDFTGRAFDDNDFVERLFANGNNHVRVDKRVVHLHHPRDVHVDDRWRHNESLFHSRRTQLVRNIGREWGVLA